MKKAPVIAKDIIGKQRDTTNVGRSRVKGLDVPRIRFAGVRPRPRPSQDSGQTDTGPDIKGKGGTYGLGRQTSVCFESVPW